MTRSIRDQVLRALALNREPGLHFAGNFLELAFDPVTPGDTLGWIDPAAHCVDADGQLELGALLMLADMAMAAGIRAGLDSAARLATVSMTLQFTGARAVGSVRAASESEGFFGDHAARQGLSRVVVSGADGAVCHGHGAFMVLAPPPGVARFHAPRRRGDVALPAEKDLTREERAILRHADAVLAQGEADFARRLWGFAPHRTQGGAGAAMKNGAHVSNRVGHAQGGLLMGLAVATASAALPATWALSGITACFVSPGEGRTLRARSKVVHHGRTTAVVRTEITGVGRRRVLEVLTTHAHR